MTIEETIGAVLEAKLAPLRADLGRLTTEVVAIRRAMPPALVTVAQAAEQLGVSLSTVRRRVRDGSLPVRRLGRSLRVDLSGLHTLPDTEVARLAIVARSG